MYGYGPQRTHYNPTERTIGVGNVAGLTNVWTDVAADSIIGAPAVANGVVYVGVYGAAGAEVAAFDAAGSTSCSGTPKTCAPLWTSTKLVTATSPAVVNGVLYVFSNTKLLAFDAAGSTNCSGTPKICSPLWSSVATSGFTGSSPAVANGVVYVGSGNDLYAFDAAGTTGCSGTPKTCAPLWTAAVPDTSSSSPAVANGVVYIGTEDPDFGLYAFDAAGSSGCSGTPKTCSPLWTASTGGGGTDSTPAVSGGVVYIGSNDPAFGLFAFDAAGSTNCSGTPKTCSPLWNGAVDPYFTHTTPGSVAVANGLVFGADDITRLNAFDATGSTNCSGTPKICSPLWYANFGDEHDGADPTVANGVVYVGEDSNLHAYDAAGSIDCSGTTPKLCTPLWTWTAPNSAGASSPVVANGVVYVVSATKLYVFKL
jgi:hypothetical protein